MFPLWFPEDVGAGRPSPEGQVATLSVSRGATGRVRLRLEVVEEVHRREEEAEGVEEEVMRMATATWIRIVRGLVRGIEVSALETGVRTVHGVGVSQKAPEAGVHRPGEEMVVAEVEAGEEARATLATTEAEAEASAGGDDDRSGHEGLHGINQKSKLSQPQHDVGERYEPYKSERGD